ncbi:hypothetical protein [Pseudomonas guariconensis]|uniref:hypothetical protein n=1 Tax=Pseudomonas guariconensis TaxID=1288410 RepID=UPI00209A764A|nr:hypothetical protein [Pseudomonas guariconensis]MCO7620180.1 hypothetical protein [Pseudomonas guariconensis]
MTSATSTTFAHRLGRAVGLAVRFCLYDRNPKVRWGKRVLILGPLLFVLVSNISWVLSTTLTTILLMAGLYAFSKADSDKVDLFAKEKDKKAPYGRDVFGCPLDSWGDRVDGLD